MGQRESVCHECVDKQITNEHLRYLLRARIEQVKGLSDAAMTAANVILRTIEQLQALHADADPAVRSVIGSAVVEIQALVHRLGVLVKNHG